MNRLQNASWLWKNLPYQHIRRIKHWNCCSHESVVGFLDAFVNREQNNKKLVIYKKVAGEFIATKQNTHRPSPTRAAGLRARDKGLLIILQTEEQNKFGGMNYV